MHASRHPLPSLSHRTSGEMLSKDRGCAWRKDASRRELGVCSGSREKTGRRARGSPSRPLSGRTRRWRATRPAWNGRCAGEGAPLRAASTAAEPAGRPCSPRDSNLENISLQRLGTIQLLRIPKPWKRASRFPHLGAQNREAPFSLFFSSSYS